MKKQMGIVTIIVAFSTIMMTCEYTTITEAFRQGATVGYSYTVKLTNMEKLLKAGSSPTEQITLVGSSYVGDYPRPIRDLTMEDQDYGSEKFSVDSVLEDSLESQRELYVSIAPTNKAFYETYFSQAIHPGYIGTYDDGTIIYNDIYNPSYSGSWLTEPVALISTDEQGVETTLDLHTPFTENDLTHPLFLTFEVVTPLYKIYNLSTSDDPDVREFVVSNTSKEYTIMAELTKTLKKKSFEKVITASTFEIEINKVLYDGKKDNISYYDVASGTMKGNASSVKDEGTHILSEASAYLFTISGGLFETHFTIIDKLSPDLFVFDISTVAGSAVVD